MTNFTFTARITKEMRRDARREYARRFCTFQSRLRAYALALGSLGAGFLTDSIRLGSLTLPLSPGQFPLTYLAAGLLTIVVLIDVLLALARLRLLRIADRLFSDTRIPSGAWFFVVDDSAISLTNRTVAARVPWTEFRSFHDWTGCYVLTTADDMMVLIPTADVDEEPLRYIRDQIARYGRPNAADARLHSAGGKNV